MIFLSVVIWLFLIRLFVLCIMRWRRVLFFGICLIFYWMGAMYSVSIHESFQTTLKLVNNWILSEATNYYYFFEQSQKLFIWIILWWITYAIPRKFLKRWKYLYFIWSLLLMLLLFSPLWRDFDKWATLWLQIWWNTIQPWEFFKIWFVFFLTSRLVRKRKAMNERQFYVWFSLISLVAVSIFFVLPDFWSLLVLWPTALILYRYLGWKKYFIGLTLIFALFWWMIASSQFSYVQERVQYFLNPDADQSRWIWRQTRQALIAVWWGGLTGKWYGKGLQKFWYIPEAQSDFIFSAFAEEVWFIGSLLLLSLYFMLMWHAIKWLRSTKDLYDRWIIIWLISLILIQAFVNIGVNIKMIPLTWITLPFVSHWWSALIVNVVQVVLLHKIIYKI